ncbi:hypothetical protein FGO68_gene12449 [Halteria grandinella]|uniref:Uncharacterized protein n=1 Tax=Halteria grandinella TaxID=5974 RepID=A0A8J8NWY9_HALGN|nr:hypothetical protein FGO68_gene12449 [Halteria grandinella]
MQQPQATPTPKQSSFLKSYTLHLPSNSESIQPECIPTQPTKAHSIPVQPDSSDNEFTTKMQMKAQLREVELEGMLKMQEIRLRQQEARHDQSMAYMTQRE